MWTSYVNGTIFWNMVEMAVHPQAVDTRPSPSSTRPGCEANKVPLKTILLASQDGGIATVVGM